MSAVSPFIQLATALPRGEGDARLSALAEVERVSPDGCLVLRAVREATGAILDFECVFSNASAERLTSRFVGPLLGRRRVETFPSVRGGRFGLCCQVVQTGQPCVLELQLPVEQETWLRVMLTRFQDARRCRRWRTRTGAPSASAPS